MSGTDLPLKGVRVVEFCQMVMGPSCGMILGDLGADVIKIEPVKGDRTRYLKGVASGFFNTFARNKRSLALDIASAEGLAVAKALIASADVLIENFRPGLMARSGLDYDAVQAFAPRLIYCSLKGFLPGPYDQRTALDEVVQMMGGLAYMTGPPGRPMRAGASVNDIMGGMFGVIAIQAALAQRERTGRGQHVQSALYENNVFLMAQAMMYESVTGQPAQPWSVKEAPWPVYDLFETRGGGQIFVSIVGEEHWRDFWTAFGKPEWLADPETQDNLSRVAARPRYMPVIAAMLKQRDSEELSALFERIGLPFAPVNTPHELFADRHLNASGGLYAMRLTTGEVAKTPALPLSFDGSRLPKRFDPPRVGEHSAAILSEIGLTPDQIEKLASSGLIKR